MNMRRPSLNHAFLLAAAALMWSTCTFGAERFSNAVAAWEAGDIEEAKALWTTLATEGDAASQYELGRLYQFGAGVPKNLATAVGWYQKAADQGFDS
ncbi:MAG: hypothetical protein QF872_06905, partial [Gammaproteobacteria bacterium]|nr:hypothetical protein [Gammaproteobacteria bacterium]